jgi:hypothetical protein
MSFFGFLSNLLSTQPRLPGNSAFSPLVEPDWNNSFGTLADHQGAAEAHQAFSSNQADMSNYDGTREAFGGLGSSPFTGE